MNMKFKLFDKQGLHIGNEYHEPNEFGVIQIYHESLRGDFKCGDGNKMLVREKYYIPHFAKERDCEFMENVEKFDIETKNRDEKLFCPHNMSRIPSEDVSNKCRLCGRPYK